MNDLLNETVTNLQAEWRLIVTVLACFTLLLIAQLWLMHRERAFCPCSGRSFIPQCVFPFYLWWNWVRCEVCDANGHMVGEPDYNSDMPGWHVVKNETAHAANVNGFRTRE